MPTPDTEHPSSAAVDQRDSAADQPDTCPGPQGACKGEIKTVHWAGRDWIPPSEVLRLQKVLYDGDMERLLSCQIRRLRKVTM